MQFFFKLIIICFVLIFVILRKMNALVRVKIEKQTQGPYKIMYKEYQGIPFGRAYRTALDDFKRVKVSTFPIIIVRFNDAKENSTSKRLWIGVAIHLETKEEFPALFKEYTEDFMYKEVYQSCNVICRNHLSELVLPQRVYPKLRRYVKQYSMEVIDHANGVLRFIADPIFKNLTD